jgi:hypothetical protein
MAEHILYGYGTACSGLDWRFLKQVALAESGLNPKNHTGKYVGLFQMAKDGCAENTRAFKSFLSCDDLEDPEVNTAAAADRFDRYFRGRSGYPSILKTCPANSPAENMALAYVGHNNGPAVLKHALKRRACKDAAVRKAITSFYENHPGSRDDGKFVNKDGRLVSCSPKYEAKYGIVGTKSFRCVNAKWGLAKYDYGRRRVALVKGIERLYVPEIPGRTLQCPAETGKRLFSKREIVVALANGTFKEKPLGDQTMIAQLAERSRQAAAQGALAYARADEDAASWNRRENRSILIAGGYRTGLGVGDGGADKPGAQLPARFVPVSASPPQPIRLRAAKEDEDQDAPRSTVASFGGQPKSGGKSFSFWGFIKSLFGF